LKDFLKEIKFSIDTDRILWYNRYMERR
jgi:hypothetical protein